LKKAGKQYAFRRRFYLARDQGLAVNQEATKLLSGAAPLSKEEANALRASAKPVSCTAWDTTSTFKG